MDCADDGGALSTSLVLEHFTNFQGGCAIETTRRLITEKQVGVSNEFVPNACPFSLTTGDSFDHLATNASVSAILKTESFDDVIYFIFNLLII